LRHLNFIGISNKAKDINAEAVTTRILQLGVTVAEDYAAYKEYVSPWDLNDCMVVEVLLERNPLFVIMGTRCLRERSMSR
jgi:hypothetical protein